MNMSKEQKQSLIHSTRSYAGRTVFGEHLGMTNYGDHYRPAELTGKARMEQIDRGIAACNALEHITGLGFLNI